MEKVGILIVSYGSRETAMVDAFARSGTYNAEMYIADKQKNPFDVERAKEHVVIPSLDINEICKFAKKHEQRIDFGIVGPEKPIMDGIRDLIEKETDIPMICPTKAYAIEASKVAQRYLFQKVVPEANPKFRAFNPKDYGSLTQVKKDVFSWLDELGNEAVVKPDVPAAGKGVGVWGDHFNTREQLFEHFLSNYEHGTVVIEEKIEGEESSFQAFCDGKNIVPLPETRDYKRAFDGDKGPNTGGMGSYKDKGDWLPFMTLSDREKETEIVNKIFSRLRGKGKNTGLRGIPFYVAFMHSGKGPKILENNSRPGDPEILNLLPILKDDFIDVCYRILDGNLTRVELEEKATVATYKAPSNYGGFKNVFPQQVELDDINKPVDLNDAYALTKKYRDDIRIYPASMELRNGETYALTSRTVGVIGVGDNIETAREISLEGIQAIKGGALWYRTDIASKEHIAKSIEHMKRLRSQK
jgi:phosphoribosylamine--glycine ligase